MGVVVTGVVVLVDLGRWGATMRDFAINTFELNRGMVDSELLPQYPIHLLQYGGTFRRGNVGDDDVGGTGVGL